MQLQPSAHSISSRASWRSDLLSARDRDSDSPAVGCDLASGADRADGLAQILPVSDKQIIEPDPIPARQFPAQSHFRIFRGFGSDIAEPVRNAVHVRVDRNSRLTKAERHDDVRRLASDPRQFEKVIHARRHLAFISGQQLPGDRVDSPCLHAIERNRIDHSFDCTDRCRQHLFWCRCNRE